VNNGGAYFEGKPYFDIPKSINKKKPVIGSIMEEGHEVDEMDEIISLGRCSFSMED